ncbi:MAG: divalent metal cation transporter [Phycisphaerae bacterium]|nr:divalent metal cation transporter [Phycisphaerae bacterium]
MGDQSASHTIGEGSAVDRDRQMILAAEQKGKLATFLAYFRLSGPGWLQGAITLGGASLASSLYLGVLGGFSMLWLQPVAIIAGIVMLGAIGYVTLSTNQRPFGAINRHVNPMLGWSWAIATLIANMVFAMPQFSLATAAVRQNLLPEVVGPDVMAEMPAKAIVCGVILAVCIFIVWFYDKGSRGVRFFEIILKGMVGLVVLCFFGVVVKLSFAAEGLRWGEILRGFVPDFGLLSSPADTFAPFIDQVDERFRAFWASAIVSDQRAVMITAVSSAVGINMTFLMPYALLKRGWNRDFRGLAIFDLSVGMFVPFILATSCVLIASASQFHTQPARGLLDDGVQAPKNLVGNYNANAGARIKFEIGEEAFGALTPAEKADRIAALPEADKRMAAMLVRRDAFNLADSLTPLTGAAIAHYAFGIGVVGMGVSSIIIMMLIQGFVFCEMFGLQSKGWAYRFGSLMPAVGALGPFLWTGGKAQFWLAVPAFVFGMMILPIAYFTFYLMMNSRSLLGSDMPRGLKRWTWNILMAIASGLAAFGAVWSLWDKLGKRGIGLLVAFVAIVIVVGIIRRTLHVGRDRS